MADKESKKENIKENEENKTSENEIEIGTLVKSQNYSNLEKNFIGKVEKNYEKTILVEIVENDPVDDIVVNEMNNRAILPKDQVTEVKSSKRKAKTKSKKTDNKK